MNAFVPCHSSTPKSLSKSSVMVYQGISQPIRAFTRSMSFCDAREANASVVLRTFRCATCATWSATMEQPTHACSGHPFTPVRGTRGRRSADGGPRTSRAGSLCPWVRRTCNSSSRPATASGDARPPTRHGRGSTPSPSRAAADAQPPTPALKRSVVSSFSVPLIFSLFLSLKKFRERECGQPATRSRANCDQNEIGEANGTHGYLFPFLALFVFSKYSARRSSDPSQNFRYSSTHCAACFKGFASNCISWTRP